MSRVMLILFVALAMMPAACGKRGPLLLPESPISQEAAS